MSQKELAVRFEDELKRMGFSPVLARASEIEGGFGDGEVIMRVDPFLLRLVRDRGQEFLDVGAESFPDKFYPFHDVEVAMGWRSLEDVLATTEPESVSSILAKFRARLDELRPAFEGDRAILTIRRIEDAMRKRGEAFAARLR